MHEPMNATSMRVPAIGAPGVEPHELQRLLDPCALAFAGLARVGEHAVDADRLARVDAPRHRRLDRIAVERHAIVVTRVVVGAQRTPCGRRRDRTPRRLAQTAALGGTQTSSRPD